MAPNSHLLGGLGAVIRPSARVTRAEFWAFVPFGLSLCVITAFITSLLGFTFLGTVLSVFAAGTPLLILWWGRLQDVGIWGAHALSPWLSLFAFFLCASAAYALQNEAEAGFRQARDHLYGWAMMPEILFKFVGGKWVALLLALISLFIFLFRVVFSVSQAMLPSDPTTNRYGPNPHEVPQ